ncbi:hypothetical protein PVAP13_3KG386400 [Panicum virgatum]|uniref:DUF7792 domain-containing protein n=1 Tax=Panicum virgatum TaxID=38727 RepID=A0A8T0UW46_PANVG|nr:hypothetical protein PVAP13_3KG386400 [Panicum virgatum]
MESLSTVRSIVGIAQELLAAVETASRSKSHCERVAERVGRLRDLLRELDGAQEGMTTEDATRSLLERLEEALRRALRQARRCQPSGGFLRALVIAGVRMADPLDEVEREIDRCTLLRQQNVVASTDDNGGVEKQENRGKVAAAGSVPDDKKADPVALGDDADMDEEDTIEAEDVTTIGVPVCTVTAGTREHDHDHQIVPLLSHSYGYCCCCCYSYWRFSHGHGTCDCWHDYAGGPYDAVVSPVHTVHVQRRQPQLLLDYLSSRGAPE